MKTILITGSTDGIGKIAAKKMARQGHDIILHGRNQEKLNQTITEIKMTSSSEKITGFLADFSDLGAVKNMAEAVKKAYPRLDVLINNAGVFKSVSSKNQQGLDIRFVVNYLAPYLLTNELLPLLQKSKEPRVINLSSAAQSPVSLKALAGKEALAVQQAYAQSKLALTMWSFDMAQRVGNISVIAVNPGSLLDTKMVQEAYGQHWSPAAKGANILYDLAISQEYQGVTGKYFDNDRGELKGMFAEAHAEAYDLLKRRELIAITTDMLTD